MSPERDGQSWKVFQALPILLNSSLGSTPDSFMLLNWVPSGPCFLSGGIPAFANCRFLPFLGITVQYPGQCVNVD